MARTDVMKVLLRVPRRLHNRLTKEASREGVSYNALLVRKLEGASTAVADEELGQKLEAAAKRSGRSVAEEAEFRLERSFEKEGLLREVLALAIGTVGAEVLERMYKTGQLSDLFRRAEASKIDPYEYTIDVLKPFPWPGEDKK
jgi:predicted HicB family RNase H-like nuclease